MLDPAVPGMNPSAARSGRACETGGDRTRRLNLDTLRAEVDRWFAPDALERILAPGDSETEQIAHAWLARSGCRRRPFLAVCAFQAFQENPGRPAPDDLRKIAVAVGCFHKASLIHEDIENTDALRCSRKTLHEQYGVPIALNVGDLLLGEGYRLICEARVSAGRRSEMLRVAADGHLNLCVGQGAGLSSMRGNRPLSSSQVLDIFGKRASPVFDLALRLGVIYADAHENSSPALRGYSQPLGVACQICDDLSSYFNNDEPNDVRAMRPSLLLAIAYERAEGPAKQRIEDLWRRRLPIDKAAEDLRKIFADLKVTERAAQLLELYKKQAVSSLRSLDNAGLKGLLQRVVGMIFNDVQVPRCCDDRAG